MSEDLYCILAMMTWRNIILGVREEEREEKGRKRREGGERDGAERSGTQEEHAAARK